jgi:hypothetical protein
MDQKKIDKCMKALRKAVETLPEYRALMTLVTRNHTLELSLEEHAYCDVMTENVKYLGCTPAKGTNAYLLNFCGLEYFRTDRTPEAIALEIQKVVDEVLASDPKDAMFGFNVSSRLHDILYHTDEVYPHMRSEAIGTFSYHEKLVIPD